MFLPNLFKMETNKPGQTKKKISFVIKMHCPLSLTGLINKNLHTFVFTFFQYELIVAPLDCLFEINILLPNLLKMRSNQF